MDTRVVSREEWDQARQQLLKLEKEHTRAGDQLAARRRDLPWVALEQDYVLDTDDGPKRLAELFDGHSQLAVYHFMFGPSYTAGDPSNSSIADSLDGIRAHLRARDVTLLLVSSAPLERLRAYKDRMGWRLPWVSAANSTFNYDLGGSSTPEQVRSWIKDAEPTLPAVVPLNAAAAGTNVCGYLTEAPTFTAYALRDGTVYQTYSTSARGVEFLMTYYPILDRLPKGRGEDFGFQLWLRRHDEYV